MTERGYEMTKVDGVMGLFVLTPINLFVSGFVLFKLWSWFVVPALHWPAISYGQAIGIGMTVTAVTYSISTTRKHLPWYESMILSALTDGTFLLIGFLVHAAIT